jgi:hypothetical protein
MHPQSMQNRYAGTGVVISVYEPSWYSQTYVGWLVAQTLRHFLADLRRSKR